MPLLLSVSVSPIPSPCETSRVYVQPLLDCRYCRPKLLLLFDLGPVCSWYPPEELPPLRRTQRGRREGIQTQTIVKVISVAVHMKLSVAVSTQRVGASANGLLLKCGSQFDRIGLTMEIRCPGEYIKIGSANNTANPSAIGSMVSSKAGGKVTLLLTSRRDSRKCRQ